MKHVIWILLGKFLYPFYTTLYYSYPTYTNSHIFHSFFYSNYHATCFQVPPRAMAGMSAEDFVEEHLVDKTTDEVRYLYYPIERD